KLLDLAVDAGARFAGELAFVLIEAVAHVDVTTLVALEAMHEPSVGVVVGGAFDWFGDVGEQNTLLAGCKRWKRASRCPGAYFIEREDPPLNRDGNVGEGEFTQV